MSTLRADNAGPSAGGTAYSLTEGVAKLGYTYDQITPIVNYEFNVTAITDAATGDYEVSITNPFTSVDAMVGAVIASATAPSVRWSTGGSTSSVLNILTTGSANSTVDTNTKASFAGDLA